MFNEKMEITPENGLMLFIKMAIKNVDFALISIDFILNTQNIDYNIYQDRHTFYFYYIQNLLTACGNISSIFNSPIGFKSERSGVLSPYRRSKALREMCNLNPKEFPLIFKREARNTNMHFDERYDEYDKRIGDYNIIDGDTSFEERQEILNTPHLRTYNKQDQVYITVNRRGEKIEYSIIQLRQELVKLKQLLNVSNK